MARPRRAVDAADGRWGSGGGRGSAGRPCGNVTAQPGRLYICATPIGNLGDVTLRVLDALRDADVVLAEDTRVTAKLFARYGIDTPLERYDEATAAHRTPLVVERVLAGASIALVSDAGTPGISDPGQRLVNAAREAGLTVETLPGASALLGAVVASGLPAHPLYFGGFLPRKAGERRALFASLEALPATLVFYESPKRTVAALAALAEAFPLREGVLARELTKRFEEVVRLPLPELAAQVAARDSLKGEVVLLVAPPGAAASAAHADVDDESVRARMEALVADGTRRSEAAKLVARELGVTRQRAYESLG